MLPLAWRNHTPPQGPPDLLVKVPRLEHDYSGFDFLSRAHAAVGDRVFDTIGIDMRTAGWLSACMTAPLAMLLDRWVTFNNACLVTPPPMRVVNPLRRIGFLPLFGYAPLVDGWGSALPLLHIPARQSQIGGFYLRDQFAGRRLFPAGVSDDYKVELLSAFGEVFTNAEMHADTRNLYTCGQYFPNSGKLTMSVADGGRTIARNVADYLRRPLSDVEAIDWAFGEGHTTSINQHGGDGLWDLRNFVRENDGVLVTVSGHGFWRQSGTRVSRKTLAYPFPGTAVLWEINLLDGKVYR